MRGVVPAPAGVACANAAAVLRFVCPGITPVTPAPFLLLLPKTDGRRNP